MSKLIRLLQKHKIYPSKKWGQNFLIHTESADKIVRFAKVEKGDAILEIGPGLGQLTESLVRTGASVIGIEKDRRLVAILRSLWEDQTEINLIHDDALRTDYKELLQGITAPLKAVGNLPYSISTPILEKLLELSGQLEDMVFLLQEEVVDRLAAKVGTKSYGRLAIWVQTLCEIERGPRIPRGSFHPVPDVESRLIRLTPRKSPRVPKEDLESFLKTVALVFQQRRKSIRNALKNGGFPIDDIDRVLQEEKIDSSRRPQTFTIEELHRLSFCLRD